MLVEHPGIASFAVMPVLTSVVTLDIGTNIVIFPGMVGALPIVRFRTAVEVC